MRRVAACVVVTGLVSALALSASVAAQPRRHVTIAAGAVDGVDYPIAGAMSRITSDARGLSVRATVESSAGSVANVQLIRSGEADFALLQNAIAYYAFNGIALGAFAGKPVKGMAGVFSVYPELVHIVVSPAVGSGSEQNALQILEIYGIGGGDLRAAVRVSFTAAVDQLKAGVVDAAFFTTALGAPVVAEAFGSGQLELLGVGPTAGEALGRKYPFYTIGEIPANTYKGQEREVATASVMAMLVARSALSEDLVYRFTKAVFDNLPQLYAAHAAARNLTLQTALVGMPLPLHRGAERFFKEKGISR